MLAKVLSGAIVGLEAVPITVEVDIASQGLPSFTIVGLPDKAVEESKERVRAALKNTGAEFPAKRITVNLAPADLPKAGPAYDLPIAVGILIASGQLPQPQEESLYLGELSLDGSLRHTNGVLSLAILAKKEAISTLYLPSIDAIEAAIIQSVQVIPVSTLGALFRHLSHLAPLEPQSPVTFAEITGDMTFEFDMQDIQGQNQVKRALEIAAAGGHNIFLKGPPGAGKTMLARTLPSILPELTEEEALEVTKIYSVTGNLPVGQSIMKVRPFRAPHHTTSRMGLIGGGTHPMPGEISLAHRGVLFLDEFPEFPRHVLEALRQPLEDGIVSISRAAGSVIYPAKFLLIAAANPCPCGNYGSETKRCTCLPGSILRYQKRVSGPILDRIDMHVTVPSVQVEALAQMKKSTGETSSVIQKRVQKARSLQHSRLKKYTLFSNAELSTRLVRELCVIEPAAEKFLSQAISKYGLSARSYYRVLKVAQTIADLAGVSSIALPHMAEALQYRPPTDSF